MFFVVVADYLNFKLRQDNKIRMDGVHYICAQISEVVLLTEWEEHGILGQPKQIIEPQIMGLKF